MEWVSLAAVLVMAAALVLVVKGLDVRLVLLVAALVLATLGAVGLPNPSDTPLAARLAKSLSAVVREFLGTFSNEKFVVPICSAMGFAYVLRLTGCERHLVLLLVRPLRHVRILLVPGVLLVGFLVNVPVISQTSTAVCIGPVVVPLMRAAGYSPLTVGATLLLGASVGGELFNPGAPELLTVFDKTGVPTTVQAREYLPKLVLTQLLVATLLFWGLCAWAERPSPLSPSGGGARGERATPTQAGGGTGQDGHPLTPNPSPQRGEGQPDAPPDVPERINPFKALVPLVPLVLLFACGLPAPLKLFDVPDYWLVTPKPGATGRDPAYSSRLIGLAMLVGVLVAVVATPRKGKEAAKAFFDGAGYGFANVVSLIVIANCFGKGIEQVGLAAALGDVIRRFPDLMSPLAGFVPLAFAFISGSGMASTQSLYGFFYTPAVEHGHDPVAVGALVSLGAAAGRTMSPVAAVVLMCATLTGTSPLALVRRVGPPLVLGMAVVVGLRMMKAI